MTRTICLMVLTAIAIAGSMAWLRAVMVPFVVAAFVSVVVSPIIDTLRHRFGLPRSLAMVATVTIAGTLLVLLTFTVTVSVMRVANHASLYETRFNELVDMAHTMIPAQIQAYMPGGEEAGPSKLGAAASSALSSVAGATLNVISRTFLVLIFMAFMITSGVGHAKPGTVLKDIENKLRGYMFTKLATSSATAILVGITLTALRVELAFVFAVFTFFLNFVPNIGSGIAVMLPMPLVIMHPDATIPWVIATIAIPTLIQVLIGNVVEPKLMGDRMALHPVVVLMSLIFWGVIWGLVGALLAVPLTATLKLLFERFELTAPVARLMEGHVEGPFGDRAPGID